MDPKILIVFHTVEGHTAAAQALVHDLVAGALVYT